MTEVNNNKNKFSNLPFSPFCAQTLDTNQIEMYVSTENLSLANFIFIISLISSKIPSAVSLMIKRRINLHQVKMSALLRSQDDY